MVMQARDVELIVVNENQKFTLISIASSDVTNATMLCLKYLATALKTSRHMGEYPVLA
jgi:hypothetical protein